ncbi:hypothetical protein I3842_04G017300 [Carya illinoinensis]|uniref:ZF-HD dimerization-type domain-containing protein n=1 Tax=Carya illinoinensis TaxID=32201 RepID=A0A922JPT1_CARIL|nr:hypothetical protein I3842_04G017300 [Carya illinoinensis]
MDITPTIATTANNTISAIKSPEADTETPTRIQPSKPLSFSNGVLKRHNPHHHHHLAPPQLVVTYKQCLKNHAASLGSHALDGCGEFMPSPSATSVDPTSLKCAACGCHRNFHRREPDDPIPTTHDFEYRPHHRHHPLPPPPLPALNRSPNSASPPPISSSYYPASAPHMLLALSGGLSAPPESAAGPTNTMVTPSPNARKRFRTKFSHEQKEKMLQFAQRVGWKMQKSDEELVQEFCNDVGVDKGVLKVWMHNNKNTFGRRDVNGTGGNSNNILEQTHNNGNDDDDKETNNLGENPNHYHSDSGAHGAANGSSSSS